MTKFYGIPAALIGVSITLIQPQVASALSSAEVGKIAEQITVLIEGNNSIGSGVLIKHSGNTYYVLTCKHVVEKPDKYTIVTPGGDRYPLDNSKVKKLQSGLDLAVVQFNSNKTYTVAKLGNSNAATVGTVAYVAGFPEQTSVVTRSIFRFLPGEITANASQALDNGYALLYTLVRVNNTLGGMSGGPVLNENGEVVGIHGRTETTAEDGKQINTGFNLGIPINTFVKLSRSIGINLPPVGVPSPPTTAPIADDSYKQAMFKLEDGDYQGAIADFERSLSQNSNNASVYYNRGLAYHSLGDMQKALADWQQAASLAQQQGNMGLYQKAHNRIRALQQ